MLDDEFFSSKAVDIDIKTLSSRKSGKESSTVDVICDSCFQFFSIHIGDAVMYIK